MSAARCIECLALLAAWDERDPWEDVAVQKLTTKPYALSTYLTKPRIVDVRGGEVEATLLRKALGAGHQASDRRTDDGTPQRVACPRTFPSSYSGRSLTHRCAERGRSR